MIVVFFCRLFYQFYQMEGEYDRKQLLKNDQALVPQNYKKTLQSRALMNHYQEQVLLKMDQQRQKNQQKIRELEYSKKQNQRHLYEQQLKKRIKENSKNEYSQVYDQMIQQRKDQEQRQKQQTIWLEQQLLQQHTWIKNQQEQKDAENIKKAKYAKELEQHLTQQARKRKEEVIQLHQKAHHSLEPPKNQEIEPHPKRQSLGAAVDRSYHQKHLGVGDILGYSHVSETVVEDRQEVSPRMQRLLKVQAQRNFDEKEYKSEREKEYFQRVNPEKGQYNPITNPIPYLYRNPKVLQFIANSG